MSPIQTKVHRFSQHVGETMGINDLIIPVFVPMAAMIVEVKWFNEKSIIRKQVLMSPKPFSHTFSIFCYKISKTSSTKVQFWKNCSCSDVNNTSIKVWITTFSWDPCEKLYKSFNGQGFLALYQDLSQNLDKKWILCLAEIYFECLTPLSITFRYIVPY